MLGNIGVPTLILIIVLALLLFGPNKLPELGRAFGKTLREFKKGARDIMEDDGDELSRKEVNRTESHDTLPGDRSEVKREDHRRLPE